MIYHTRNIHIQMYTYIDTQTHTVSLERRC